MSKSEFGGPDVNITALHKTESRQSASFLHLPTDTSVEVWSDGYIR